MSQFDLTKSRLDCDYVGSRIILFVFRFMGLAPFVARRSTSRGLRKKCAWQITPTVHFSTSRFGCAYNLILVPLQVWILTRVVPISYEEYYPNKTSMTSAIDMISCGIGHAVLFAIWLILGFRQRTAVRLLNRLTSFDCTTLSSNANQATPKRRYRFNVFLTCFVYVGISVGAVVADQQAFGFLFVSCVMTGVPLIIVAWFIGQYGFVVKLIKNRFETLNRTLLECNVPSTHDLTQRTFVVQDLNVKSIPEPNIADLRRAHGNISAIASETANFYSVPILLSIANQCYSLILNGHYLIVTLAAQKEETPVVQMAAALFWISLTIVPIAILSAGVTDVTKEAKRTCDVVKKLLTHSNNGRNTHVELQQFLLQLLHQDIRFTACGLFSLDLTLVQSIIRTIVTYIVILLQFQRRSTDKVS